MRDNEKAESNYKRFLSDTNRYCNSEKEERINKRLLVSDSEVICNNGIEMNEYINKRLLTTVTNEERNSKVRS